MRIPNLQRGSQYRVTIPALNGGVNLNDAPNLVEDNQLTDVRNMWWKDQALRTRPGLQTAQAEIRTIGSVKFCRFLSPVRLYVQGEPADYIGCFYGDGETVSTFMLYCFHEDGSMETVAQHVFWEGGDPYADGVFLFDSNPSASSLGLYMVFNNGQIFTLTPAGVMTQIQPSSIYAPLVVVNAMGNSEAGVPPATNGTSFEGYNLLTGAFRTAFTTDGISHEFRLPQDNLTRNNGESPLIEYTGPDGTVTRWSDFSNTMFYAQASAQIDGKTVFAKLYPATGTVEFSSGDNEAYPLAGIGRSNNLVVTAWKSDAEAVKKIANMSFSTWFGGDRSGVNGGTRLFVSGNPDYPHLVHWSDLNQPLYFPENNGAYVGRSSQKVTGFGKQADILVIFKEHEIYGAEYVSGNSYTAQDVLDGKVQDVTANAAVFPLTPIHAGIGCDCPRSIQLCSNRLIWATSDAHVYGLMALTQGSERNVRDLSALIRARLSAESESALRQATSCDYDGHYLLCVSGRVYLLDYMDGSFQYYANYVDERKAQRNMPWHIWEFEGSPHFEAMLSSGQGMAALVSDSYVYQGGDGALATRWIAVPYRLEGTGDDVLEWTWSAGSLPEVHVSRKTVEASFQTKQFDFGAPDRKKTIRRLYIGMAGEAGVPVRAAYITENGTQEDVCGWETEGMDIRREQVVTPGLSRISRFGLRVESHGPISVEGLVIRYERNGEVG